MKIFLVSRTDSIGWDEFDGMVVISENRKTAIQMTPDDGFYEEDEEGEYSGPWVPKEKIDTLTIELLGESHESKERVVLASFNAG